jgi:hypothetical protein
MQHVANTIIKKRPTEHNPSIGFYALIKKTTSWADIMAVLCSSQDGLNTAVTEVKKGSLHPHVPALRAIGQLLKH